MPDPEDQLLPSTDALNVLDLFVGTRYNVFVEGEDDIIFWSSIFEKSGISDCNIDQLGGKKPLEEMMLKIINENARVIVACDSEYSMFLGYKYLHRRIIYTYGHSIENTMYCPHIVNHVIKKLSRSTENNLSAIIEWYKSLCDTVSNLMVYELAREKFGKSIKITGKNCSRFLKSNKSQYLDTKKINNYLNSVHSYFTPQELDECKNILKNTKIENRYIISGHFLTNAVINLIKWSVSQKTRNYPTIPLDVLYALMVDGCKLCSIRCKDCNSLKNKITKSINLIN